MADNRDWPNLPHGHEVAHTIFHRVRYYRKERWAVVWYLASDVTAYGNQTNIKCSSRWCNHSYNTHIEAQWIYRCIPQSATDQRTNLHDIFAHHIGSQHYHVFLEIISFSTMPKNCGTSICDILQGFVLENYFCLEYKNNVVDWFNSSIHLITLHTSLNKYNHS